MSFIPLLRHYLTLAPSFYCFFFNTSTVLEYSLGAISSLSSRVEHHYPVCLSSFSCLFWCLLSVLKVFLWSSPFLYSRKVASKVSGGGLTTGDVVWTARWAWQLICWGCSGPAVPWEDSPKFSMLAFCLVPGWQMYAWQAAFWEPTLRKTERGQSPTIRLNLTSVWVLTSVPSCGLSWELFWSVSPEAETPACAGGGAGMGSGCGAGTLLLLEQMS